MNRIKYYNRPLTFYSLSLSVTWVFWFIAAFLSHSDAAHIIFHNLAGIFELMGLVSPAVIAFSMMYRDPHLRGDMIHRVFRLSDARASYLMMACFLMPLSIILAQVISLFFGHSIDQFTFSGHASFSFSLFSPFYMLIIAPVFEELAWHSYGTDCLRSRFNLFITSMIFALFWVFWHLPLSFIKNYYQSNILEIGWVYWINFALSLFPFVLLMNWLYYKTQRNTLIAVIFHITAGLFNEMFQTHPDSKVIQTVLLAIVSSFVVYKERALFFKRKFQSQKD